jgi:hypothetical protein
MGSNRIEEVYLLAIDIQLLTLTFVRPFPDGKAKKTLVSKSIYQFDTI